MTDNIERRRQAEEEDRRRRAEAEKERARERERELQSVREAQKGLLGDDDRGDRQGDADDE